MASPPAEKATASKDPTGKSGTGDGTGHCGYGTDLKLGDRKVKATVQYGFPPFDAAADSMALTEFARPGCIFWTTPAATFGVLFICAKDLFVEAMAP